MRGILIDPNRKTLTIVKVTEGNVDETLEQIYKFLRIHRGSRMICQVPLQLVGIQSGDTMLIDEDPSITAQKTQRALHGFSLGVMPDYFYGNALIVGVKNEDWANSSFRFEHIRKLISWEGIQEPRGSG